jgi:hypothetical protein
LSLEPLPLASEFMARNDFVKLLPIERARFDELEDARFVLGPACLQGDCRDVLGGKYVRGSTLHISLSRLGQRFFGERVPGRKELNRPTGNDNVLTRDLPIARSRHHTTHAVYPAASPHAVFTFDQSAGLGVKFNENIDIEGGRRFEIKGCSDCATNGVALNHTIGLHPVNCLSNFF